MLPAPPSAKRMSSIMYQCSTCNMKFGSHELAEIHFASEEHLSKSDPFATLQMININTAQTPLMQTNLQQQYQQQQQYASQQYAHQAYNQQLYNQGYNQSATAYSPQIPSNDLVQSYGPYGEAINYTGSAMPTPQPQSFIPTQSSFNMPSQYIPSQPQYVEQQQYYEQDVLGNYMNNGQQAYKQMTPSSPPLYNPLMNNFNSARIAGAQMRGSLNQTRVRNPYTPLNFNIVNPAANQISKSYSALNFRPRTPAVPPIKKMKKDPGKVVARCDICNLDFNSTAQADVHYKSTKHLRKIKATQELLNTVGDVQKVYNDDVDDLTLNTIASRSKLYTCSICLCSTNSSAQYDQHILGSAHKEKVAKLSGEFKEVPGQLSGWFYCNTCDISCPTTVILGKHVGSQEHKDKVKEKAEAK